MIAGHRYTLKSDADERHVNRLAALVDERLREVQRASPRAALHEAATLVAMQLADELERERKARAELRARIRVAGKTLLDLIAREGKL